MRECLGLENDQLPVRVSAFHVFQERRVSVNLKIKADW